MKKLALSILVLSLLTACASPLEQRRNELIRAGQPQAYVEGDWDGCASGMKAAGYPMNFRKNVERFETDSLYKQGWTDGYDYCKTDYLRIVNSGRR